MPETVVFNIIFVITITVLVAVGFLIFCGHKKRGKSQPDDNLKAQGILQTGLTHRFNTPMHRK